MTYVLDAPTRATVRNIMAKMRELVYADLPTALVVDTAHNIVTLVPPRHEVRQAWAIRQWVRRHVQFINDPVNTQLPRTPVLMLETIQQKGKAMVNCADAAILCAALCMAIGIKCSFVAVAFGSAGANFSHIFTIANARTPNGLAKVEMDVTRPPGVARAQFSRFRRLDV